MLHFQLKLPYYKHLHGSIKGYLQTNSGGDNCHKQRDTKLLRGIERVGASHRKRNDVLGIIESFWWLDGSNG